MMFYGEYIYNINRDLLTASGLPPMSHEMYRQMMSGIL